MDQTLDPDTAFPNPDPSRMANGNYTLQFNGSIDGSMHPSFYNFWGDSLNGEGITIFYQSGPGWVKNSAIAYTALYYGAPVRPVPYEIGDITGDNITDFAFLGDHPSPKSGAEVWLYKGDRTLSGARPENETVSPSSFFTGVYPNPADHSRENTRSSDERPPSC